MSQSYHWCHILNPNRSALSAVISVQERSNSSSTPSPASLYQISIPQASPSHRSCTCSSNTCFIHIFRHHHPLGPTPARQTPASSMSSGIIIPWVLCQLITCLLHPHPQPSPFHDHHVFFCGSSDSFSLFIYTFNHLFSPPPPVSTGEVFLFSS